MGDVRNFVSQSQQAQLMEDDITIVETTELDIHNDIIKSRNESLKRVKEVSDNKFKYFIKKTGRFTIDLGIRNE